MKYANKLDSRFALILGEEEMDKGIAVIRDMSAGEQFEIPVPEILEYFVRSSGRR